LCNADPSGEVILATEYLNISDISSYNSNGIDFLPTFGPRYIDFYDDPENSRVRKANRNLDESKLDFNMDVDVKEEMNVQFNNSKNTYAPVCGDGAFYVGRLYMRIKSKAVANLYEQALSNINESSSESDYYEDDDDDENDEEYDDTEIDRGRVRHSSSKTVSSKGSGQINSSDNVKDFVAFAMINEVTMIDSRFEKGEISFQLCVGK
jgi:hypothetical protein